MKPERIRQRRPTRPLVFGLAIVLLSVTLGTIHSASAYSCGSRRCYGTNAWYGLVDGADIRITTGDMKYNSGDTAQHINSELWLIDDNYPYGNPNNDYDENWGYIAWVETGYIARPNQFYFFRADRRPGYDFREYKIADAYSERGRNNYFEIQRSSSTSFRIEIWYSGGTYVGSSIYNQMAPDRIRIGMELAGFLGGSATESSFTNSRYIHQGNHHYQFRLGDEHLNEFPTVSWWRVQPAVGNNGGDFRTRCGC